jgi:hypothetical protein
VPPSIVILPTGPRLAEYVTSSTPTFVSATLNTLVVGLKVSVSSPTNLLPPENCISLILPPGSFTLVLYVLYEYTVLACVTYTVLPALYVVVVFPVAFVYVLARAGSL